MTIKFYMSSGKVYYKTYSDEKEDTRSSTAHQPEQVAYSFPYRSNKSELENFKAITSYVNDAGLVVKTTDSVLMWYRPGDVSMAELVN